MAALDEASAQAWLDDPSRTTYLFDVRTAEEHARDGFAFARHAPGGQLVQATDQRVGVRHARILLVDHDGIRAPVVAHWLVQAGYETATVDAAFVSGLRGLQRPDIPLATETTDDAPPDPHAVVLDLRSSEAHQTSRPAGSVWTTRARVFETLRARGADHDTPLVLSADDATLAQARLVARDLREAGHARVTLAAPGIGEWERAGFAVDHAAVELAEADRIDFLFFVHDRHDGNLDAARAYLEWETGLIGQCAADELAAFRIGEAAVTDL